MQTIRQWLETVGLPQYAETFEAHDVEPGIPGRTHREDLERLGVSLGHQKRLLISLRGHPPLVPDRLTPDVSAGAPSTIESLTAQGERRQVTILFCDLVGINSAFQRLRSGGVPVHPVALPRHLHSGGSALRGISRADPGRRHLGLLRLPSRARKRCRACHSRGTVRGRVVGQHSTGKTRSRLRVRIGIASGLVVVSHILASEKSAVGETPNLAARLQTLAQPGEVIISERAWLIAAGSFEYEYRGKHVLKGIPEPTRAWRVVGPSDIPSRFDAATRGGLTSMVGREQETRLLEERWEVSRKGEGQVVLLQGEPGIGKSRMLRSFRDRLGTQIETTMQYQCSPYYVNSAFYPIANHLERALNFQRDDSLEQKLDKIEHYLLSPPPQAGDATPVSLPVEGRASSLSPGGTREHLKRSRGLGRGARPRTRTDCGLLARALSIPCDERYGPLEMSPPRTEGRNNPLAGGLRGDRCPRQAYGYAVRGRALGRSDHHRGAGRIDRPRPRNCRCWC